MLSENKFKTVPPLAAQADAASFLWPKSKQKAHRDFPAQRFALGLFRCSLQTGAAELASLRHAASLHLSEAPLLSGSHAHQSQKQKAQSQFRTVLAGRWFLRQNTIQKLVLQALSLGNHRNVFLPLTLMSLVAAEKRRVRWNQVQRCLSVSEFFAPRLSRASQGIQRTALDGGLGDSVFAYFFRQKSKAHQPAQRAAQLILPFPSLIAADQKR